MALVSECFTHKLVVQAAPGTAACPLWQTLPKKFEYCAERWRPKLNKNSCGLMLLGKCSFVYAGALQSERRKENSARVPQPLSTPLYCNSHTYTPTMDSSQRDALRGATSERDGAAGRSSARSASERDAVGAGGSVGSDMRSPIVSRNR